MKERSTIAKEYNERDVLLRYLADLQLAYYAETGKEREYAVMDAVFEAVAKVPVATDVVEVVHCGECKYGKAWKNAFGNVGFRCDLFCADVSPEAYCSYGQGGVSDGQT